MVLTYRDSSSKKQNNQKKPKTITIIFLVMRFSPGVREHEYSQVTTWLTPSNSVYAVVCAWCQWHDVSHPWENIREQLHISSEIWKSFRYPTLDMVLTTLLVMMKWKTYNTILSTNITAVEIYVYQPLIATGRAKPVSSRPLSAGYLMKKKKKKKSVEASKYFQCKPARGCSGTIEPKRLADTPQSCVHG